MKSYQIPMCKTNKGQTTPNETKEECLESYSCTFPYEFLGTSFDITYLITDSP